MSLGGIVGGAIGFIGGSLFGGGGGGGGGGGQGDSAEARELYSEQAGLAREQAAAVRAGMALIPEQTGLIREQVSTARQLREIGREQWDTYKENALPALRKLTERVDEYASPGKINEAIGAARTDVSAAYGRQRRSLMQNLGRYGVRPGSGKFSQALRSLALGQASDEAGASNRTRRGILDRDIANRFGLAGAWQGRDSSAIAGLSQAAGNFGSAGANLGGGYYRAAQGFGGAGANLGGAAGGYASMAHSTRTADAYAQGGLWSGIGSLAGSLGGAAILKYSDERLKENIKPIGLAAEDVMVYEFTYLDDPETIYTGVIAQELIETRPHLVHAPDEFLWVNYSGLFEELMGEIH